MTKSKLLRMDNIGIVVESLDAAIAFFEEIGLTLEGRHDRRRMGWPGYWVGLANGGDRHAGHARRPQPA